MEFKTFVFYFLSAILVYAALRVVDRKSTRLNSSHT